MALYAIGMKGYVEIRKALKPPKAVVTEVVVPTKTQVFTETLDRLTGYHVVTPRLLNGKKTLRNIVFTGGTVLGCLTRQHFFVVSKGAVSVKPDEVKQIPEEFEDKLYAKIHSTQN